MGGQAMEMLMPLGSRIGLWVLPIGQPPKLGPPCGAHLSQRVGAPAGGTASAIPPAVLTGDAVASEKSPTSPA